MADGSAVAAGAVPTYDPPMTLTADFLRHKFSHALDYPGYLATGTDEQRRRWGQVYDVATLTDAQASLVRSFKREMHVLVSSGIWCGDCVQQVPLIARIAEANPAKVLLRIVDRDQHRDLAELVRINGGDRVPVALLLAEDFELCALAGDRTIHRYRALARRQLGASCEIGLAAPDQQELSATLQDWLDEIERVQLMLRLSGRLRMKHND